MHDHAPKRAGAIPRSADRRVILKAAAALASSVAAGGLRFSAASAQSSTGTVTGYFAEALESGQFTTADAARSFQADFPFYAIAPHWAGSGPADARVVISLSADGLDYGDPVVVTRAEDGGPPDRDDRHFGTLVIADGQRWVRYETQDASAAPVALPDLIFHYFDATAGPMTSGLLTAAETPSSQPTIISRETWGADEALRHEGQNLENPIVWVPQYEPIQHAIIHHTVTTNFQDPMVTLRSVYEYHAVTKGWGDIGYNYLVDHLGNIYEGRFGGENVVGGHSLRYNYGSAGFAVLGTFTAIDATPEAQSALIFLVAWITRDLDPLGSAFFIDTENVPTICGHRDVLSTECPGDVLYSDLDFIRNSVAGVVDDGGGSDVGAITIGDAVTVTVANANMRSGPSTGNAIIRQLALGTVLGVTDGPTESSGYTWYAVSGTAGSGWMASIVLEKTDAAPPATGTFEIGDTVHVTTDSLNLRSSASTGASIVARMPNGTTGAVIGGPTSANSYVWWRLQTALGSGWAVETFLTAGSGAAPPEEPPTGAFAAGDRVQVATNSLYLRSGAGTGQSSIASMTNGAQLTVLSGPTSSGGYAWYRLQSATYGTGWAAGEFLSEVGAGTTPPPADGFGIGAVVATVDTLRLRTGAGTGSGTVTTLPAGAVLTITSGPTSQGGYTWYGVSSSDYGSGYCAGEFLVAAGSSGNVLEVGGSARVVDGSLNLRAVPGTGSPVVAVLAEGTRLDLLGGPQNASGYTWWRVRTTGGTTGWCVQTYLEPL